MKPVSPDAMTHISGLKRQLAEAQRDRDLAIAHDRQPYPTAEAYERACIALHKAEVERDALKAKLVIAQAALNDIVAEPHPRRREVGGGMTPEERVKKFFQQDCNCGMIDVGVGAIHEPGCGFPRPEDVVLIIRAAVAEERTKMAEWTLEARRLLEQYAAGTISDAEMVPKVRRLLGQS